MDKLIEEISLNTWPALLMEGWACALLPDIPKDQFPSARYTDLSPMGKALACCG